MKIEGYMILIRELGSSRSGGGWGRFSGQSIPPTLMLLATRFEPRLISTNTASVYPDKASFD